MRIITKQPKQNAQKPKNAKEQFRYLDSSRFYFDDNGFSTNSIQSDYDYNMINSENDFDMIPGNFSGSPSSKSPKPQRAISDDELTNIHEELANTRKQVNQIERKYNELKSEIRIVKKYGHIFKWVKNYMDRSTSHNHN